MKKMIGVIFFFVHSNVLAIDIDQTWLDNNGPSPYKLNQAGQIYILQTNIQTPGGAFILDGDNITFDLNGKTITYDNDPQIVVANGDFENGSSNWNLGGGSIFAGQFLASEIYSGAHSLKFDLASGNQVAINSQLITLAPNTQYSITGMLGDTKFAHRFVRLVGTDNSNTYTAEQIKQTWRAIQWTEAVFTTGNSPETYRVEAGISNISGTGKSVFIDDIRIQRSGAIGINILKNGVTVRNGSIIQGTGRGAWGHAIRPQNGAQISDLNITIHGPNTVAIEGLWASNMKIYNNTIINNVSTIKKRDSFHGRTIYTKGTGSEIYQNTIIGGPHMGIVSSDGANHIHHNDITLKTKYTNDFAIMLWADKGSNVHDNIIRCGDADNSCRGIHGAGRTSAGTRIYNNHIEVQQLRRNQEYGGCVIGGAYGIQIEGGTNYEIYNNHVKAIARDCDAHAYRDNGGARTNIRVFDNHFIGESLVNDRDASTARIAELSGATAIYFNNNILETNSLWLGDSHYLDGIHLNGNHIRLSSNLQSPFYPMESGRWELKPPTSIDAAPKNIRLIDNIYPDQATRDKFVSATYRRYTTKAVDDIASWAHAFTTTVEILDAQSKKLSGVTIDIEDVNGTQIFQGGTDGSGRVQVVLNEFVNTAGTVHNLNPYKISASFNGSDLQHIFTVDNTLLISCVMGQSCSRSVVPPPAVPVTPPPPDTPPESDPDPDPVPIDQPKQKKFMNVFLGDDSSPISIPCDGNIEVRTIRGDFVKEATCLQDGYAEWSGRNESGSKVSKGIYYFVEPGKPVRKGFVE